jgi:hypothetical protein
MSAAMVAFGVIAAIVLLLVIELGKALLLTEAQTRLERLPLAILRLARGRLAPRHRSTIYNDEWLPDLEFIARETDGLPTTRLLRSTWFAAGLLWSARAISASRRDATEGSGGRTSTLRDLAAVVPARFTSHQRDAVVLIRSILADRPDLPVLGVHGPWGSGKTSVLAELQQSRTDEPGGDFIVVSFNPWQIETKSAPIADLLDVIASAVHATDQRREYPTKDQPDVNQHRQPNSASPHDLVELVTALLATELSPVVVLIDDLVPRV